MRKFFPGKHAKGAVPGTAVLYRYFFTDNTPDRLVEVAQELEGQGYGFVDISQDEDNVYWLQVEKMGCHTRESLFELDRVLNTVADKHGIESYDGFEVGDVDRSDPIGRSTYSVAEKFTTVQLDVDNYPMLLEGNTAFDQFPHRIWFRHFIEMSCRYQSADMAVLPKKGDVGKLEALDRLVEKHLAKSGTRYYYVFRSTHKGLRQAYWVADDFEKANTVVSRLRLKKWKFPTEFRIFDDEEWKVYSDMRKKLPNE